MSEYQKLGSELKETTRTKLAEKFGLSVHLLTGINRIKIEDLILIKKILTDRKKSMNRRAELREYLHP